MIEKKDELSETDETEFGIRITHITWATVDGGDDLVGARAELEAKAARWRAKAEEVDPSVRIVRYDVVRYVPEGLA